jgi:hypothetical protein
MVEAAGNALLQASLTSMEEGWKPELIGRLRNDTLRQRRAWRPIGETQLRGRRIDSLDRSLRPVGDDPPGTVADTVGSCDVLLEESSEWTDARLPRVLARLKPDELQVAMVYVGDSALTWSAAARSCGLPDKFGDGVRRKLKYLGTELMARLAGPGLPLTA